MCVCVCVCVCNWSGVTVTRGYCGAPSVHLEEVKLSYRELLVGTGYHLPWQLRGHKESVLLLTKPVPLASSAG